MILRDFFMEKLAELGDRVELRFSVDIERIEKTQDAYELYVSENDSQKKYNKKIQHRIFAECHLCVCQSDIGYAWI